MANTALTPEQINDLVEMTLERPIKRSWVDLSLDFQNYMFSRRFFRNQVPEEGGPVMTWILQVTNTGSARASGLFDTDNVTVKDLGQKPQIEWAKVNTSFIYDIDEPEFNDTLERIVDYIAMRKHSMFNDFFEFMEVAMWTLPAATADPRLPYGIPYWIVKDATAGVQDFSFGGGNPSGYTSGAAGISSTTYPAWSNGTFKYAALTEDDGLDKWSAACDKCYFQAPDSFNELAGGMPDWGFFTTHDNVQRLRRHAKASNDDIGSDVGAYRGQILFKGNIVQWVAALTEGSADSNDTTNPIYGINWRTFQWVFLRGRNQRLTKPFQRGGHHDVREVHMDSWGNFRCLNRRANFVGHEA